MGASRCVLAYYLLGILLLVSVSGGLANKTVYVNPTTGSNANDCLTTGLACLTIEGAFGKAADGDSVSLADGTYTVASTLNPNWKSLNIAGAAGSMPTVTCPSPSNYVIAVGNNEEISFTNIAFKDCIAFSLSSSKPLSYHSCTFLPGNAHVGVISSNSDMFFDDCTFDGGTGSTAMLSASGNGTIDLTSCEFKNANLNGAPFFSLIDSQLKDRNSRVFNNRWQAWASGSGTSTTVLRGTTFTNNVGQSAGAVVLDGTVPSLNLELTDITASGNIGTLAGVAAITMTFHRQEGAQRFLDVTSGVFTNNTGTSRTAGGGALALTYSKTGDVTDSTVRAQIFVKGTTFANNTASNGGALQLTNIHASIEGSHFTGNTAAGKGGAIAFLTDGVLVLDGCTCTGNSALFGGAFNVDDPADATSGSFMLQNSVISDNSAASGGVLALTAEVQSHSIQGVNCTFSGNTATELGGSFFYQGTGSSSFKNCTFANGYAPTAGVSSQTSSFNTQFSDCTFRGNKASFGAVITTEKNAKAEVYNCTITENVASNEGGFSYSKGKSVVAMYHSNIFANSATRGGAFFGGDDTNTTLEYCQVNHNTADNGAVAYMLGDVTNGGKPFFLVWQSYFTGNSAQFGAVEFASVATFTTVDDCDFSYNTASASGGVFYVAGASSIAIRKSVARNNKAEFDGGIAYIADSTILSAYNSHFLTSTALRGGAFFGTDQTEATIAFSSVNSNSGSMGGAIHLDGVPYSNVNAQMKLMETTVSNNFGTTNGVGGVAFLSGSTSITFEQCTIRSNNAAYGGVLYNRDVAKSYITESVVTGNVARQGGVMFGDIESVVAGTGSNFSYNRAMDAGGVVYLGNFAKLQLQGGFMRWNTALQGGAIMASLFSTATVTNTFFTANNASNGGAIYITGDVRTTANGVLNGAVFESNVAAQDGGALWLGESATITSTQCQFIANIAAVGGAVFAEQRIVVQGGQDDCKTFKFSQDSFINNHALVSGGMLSWNVNDNQTYSPCVYCGSDFSSCLIRGNKADSFRPNTSTPLVASIFISSGHWKEVFRDSDETSNSTRLISTNTNTTVTAHTTQVCKATEVTASFPTITSGVAVGPELVVSGKDFYGQDFTDPNSRATLVVSASDPNQTAQLGGQTVASTEEGQVYFSNLVIVAKPGSIQQLRFTVLEPTRISNLDMFVRMRDCEMGEVQPDLANQCQECPRGKYSWDPSEETCSACPANALCVGGAAMYPRDGYWRAGNESTLIHECPRPESCLGAYQEKDDKGNVVNEVLREDCAEGYVGRLCHRCAPGYGRSGTDGCTECPDGTWNLLFIAMGATVGFGVMGFLIYTTRKSAKNEKDLMMMMIKIFMSYIQFVSLAAGLEINWPASLAGLFHAQKGAGSVTELFISFDCALGSPEGDGATDTEVFYKIQILYFFIPFMGVVSICLFWFGMYMFRAYFRRAERRTKGALRRIMKENAIVSTIVLLFFMHPTLTTRTFMMFACTEIDPGQWFLVQDLDIKCYDVEHTLWIMSVGLPAVVLYVIGIPTGAIFVMYRRKAILHTEECKSKFGFLYSGFEYQFYYWECIIMIRKVLVISIVVFFSQFGSLVQTGAALGLVYLAYNAHIWAMPYEEDVLDDLEKYSLLTSLFTFFFGIFLNADGIPDGWGLFLVVLIFIAQISYILLFVNTIRGEVLKKVRDVKKKVLERSRADTAGSRAEGDKQLTEAEIAAEAEYLARMRELEADTVAKAARKRRRQQQRQTGLFAKLFGRGKTTTRAPRPGLARGNSRSAGSGSGSGRGAGRPVSAKREVTNPLNGDAPASRGGEVKNPLNMADTERKPIRPSRPMDAQL